MSQLFNLLPQRIAYEPYICGQISKNTKYDKINLGSIYWPLLFAFLSDASHERWTSQIIVHVLGVGEPQNYKSTSAWSTSIPQQESVKHPDLPKCTCSSLFVLWESPQGVGGKAQLRVRENTDLLHPSAQAWARCLQVNHLSSFPTSVIQQPEEQGEQPEPLWFWDTFNLAFRTWLSICITSFKWRTPGEREAPGTW